MAAIARIRLTVLVLTVMLLIVVRAQDANENPAKHLRFDQFEAELEQCPVVQRLNAHKSATSPSTTSVTARIFSLLFPATSPAINALLATTYISGPPNFLLALCPPNIDPASLTIMVAFAVGGLLGDTLFHLLPEIFLGEDHPDRIKLVLLEPNRNLLLGVGIMVGFVAFVAMDKSLRIATGGSGHSHSHAHSETESDPPGDSPPSSSSVAKAANGDLKQRKIPDPDFRPPPRPCNTTRTATTTTKSTTPTPPATSNSPSGSIKLAGLLNLLADFTHNITDGLALSSSFYASPTLGATTCVAVFFHEIPHEVGDFALLIQSGFSKQRAMAAQFLTAAGAFLGTLIGIVVNEYGGSGGNDDGSHVQGEGNEGIFGTTLTWGDMLLPFTAGTFLYVGTVAVIPDLLETERDSTKTQEVRKTVYQFMAMFTGAAIMLAISWS